MFILSEENIKAFAGDIIFKRGLDMYLRNKVRQINIEDYKYVQGEETCFNLNAVVESSTGYNSNYNVLLHISSSNNIISYDCNCPAYINSYGNGMCKHIVAVLIKFLRERNKVFERCGIMDKKHSDNILAHLKSGIYAIGRKKETISLNVKFGFDSMVSRTSWVELKIGKDKFYIVKNIKELLSTIKYKNQTIFFGSHFTFDPDITAFSSEDSNLMDLLVEVFESNEYLENSYMFINSSLRFLNGKKAYLTESQIKRFFRIMKGKKFEGIIKDDKYEDISILEEDLPLTFDIRLANASIILEQTSNMPLPLTADFEYFFYEGKIYRPSEDQRNVYAPFYSSLTYQNKNFIALDKSYSGQIASYILPGLKSISDNVNIDTDLKDNFYSVPLKINAYLDKAGEDVTCDLQFHYEDILISPFNDVPVNKDEDILIRDIVQENAAVNLLSEYGFYEENRHYVLKGENLLYNFLSQGLQNLQEMAEVYYSDEFKNIKLYNPQNIRASIKLNDSDLLEFSFNLGEIDKNELKDILLSIREKKKYYKLKKGGFIPLYSNELSNIASLIDYLGIKDSDLTKESILLKKFNAMYIEESLKQNEMIYIEKNEKFQALIDSMQGINESEFKVPEHLEGVLRNYQKTGFKWFKTLSSYGFGGILADEMGLGKTIETIAFLSSELIESDDKKEPAIVIAPTSLIYNWKSEIEKFSPSLKTIIITGNKKERAALIDEIRNTDIVITSYPLVRRDIDNYEDIHFSYCILDEAQQIKNPSSQNAECVKTIKADGFFALTGTPIENSLMELWSIFDFIMPGYLFSYGKFSKKYEIPIVKSRDKGALIELNKHIHPFILRRLKSDVVKELPPKIEHKFSVEMTSEQKKLYMAYLSTAREEMNFAIQDKGFGRSKIKILSLLTRLRQICCEPSIFIDNYKGESGKMIALDELIEESINEGHRILLFSQFTSVLKHIQNRLIKRKIDFLYLDGSTRAADRLSMADSFNSGTGSVFLISLKAGGTGLNLTGADVVIHFDPWWNPAVEEQAIDRAHRIGQEKSVEVIKLLTRGTIEEKIYELQEKKKEIINSVMNDGSSEDIFISKMSQEEIEDLFK